MRIAGLKFGPATPGQTLELVILQKSDRDWAVHPISAHVGNVHSCDSSLIERLQRAVS